MKINRLITKVNKWGGRFGEEVEWIVMHYTAGDGDTAKGNCQYFYDTYHAASAHFFVDKTSVWQSVELCDTAWHCGTPGTPLNGCTNPTSIGIEMCSKKDANGVYFIPDETVENAAWLVWKLLDLYPNAKLCRHYDVTGKRCPMPWVDDESLWHEFQRKIKEDKPMTPAERKRVEALENKVEALTKALAKSTKAYETLATRIGICEDVDLKQSKTIKELDSRTEVRWNTVDSCPKWLEPTVEKVVKKGYLKGDKAGLAITNEMGRILVIEDRAGVFDK